MYRTTLLALVALTLPIAANAAPPCVGLYGGLEDVDGDGYCTATAPVVFPAGTPLVKDCDDAHAFINPGATEIRNDGHDNDCDASTLDTLPVSEQIWKRYVAAEYNGRAPSWEVFVYEKAQCAAPNCTVDDVAGRFVPEDEFRMADIFVNGTKVMRTHGEPADGRELVTDEEFSHFQVSARRGTGYGKKAITGIATDVATELVDGLEDEMRDEFDRLDGELEDLRGDVSAHDDEIVEARGGMSDMDARHDRNEADILRVETEVIAARGDKATVNDRLVEIEGNVTSNGRTARAAQSTANAAQLDATKALETGFYADLMATGGLTLGATLPEYDLETEEPTGNTLRNGVGVYGGGGVQFGAQLPGARLGPFGYLAVVGDGGPAAGSMWGTGFDAAFRIRKDGVFTDNYVGPSVWYMAQNTMLNAMEGRVVERGILIGAVYQRELPSAFEYDEAIFGARLGCGPTTMGAAGEIDGSVEVFDKTLFRCGLQVSVGGGVNTAVGR